MVELVDVNCSPIEIRHFDINTVAADTSKHPLHVLLNSDDSSHWTHSYILLFNELIKKYIHYYVTT